MNKTTLSRVMSDLQDTRQGEDISPATITQQSMEAYQNWCNEVQDLEKAFHVQHSLEQLASIVSAEAHGEVARSLISLNARQQLQQLGLESLVDDIDFYSSDGSEIRASLEDIGQDIGQQISEAFTDVKQATEQLLAWNQTEEGIAWIHANEILEHDYLTGEPRDVEISVSSPLLLQSGGKLDKKTIIKSIENLKNFHRYLNNEFLDDLTEYVETITENTVPLLKIIHRHGNDFTKTFLGYVKRGSVVFSLLTPVLAVQFMFSLGIATTLVTVMKAALGGLIAGPFVGVVFGLIFGVARAQILETAKKDHPEDAKTLEKLFNENQKAFDKLADKVTSKVNQPMPGDIDVQVNGKGALELVDNTANKIKTSTMEPLSIDEIQTLAKMVSDIGDNFLVETDLKKFSDKMEKITKGFKKQMRKNSPPPEAGELKLPDNVEGIIGKLVIDTNQRTTRVMNALMDLVEESRKQYPDYQQQ